MCICCRVCILKYGMNMDLYILLSCASLIVAHHWLEYVTLPPLLLLQYILVLLPLEFYNNTNLKSLLLLPLCSQWVSHWLVAGRHGNI